ncbi:13914_t:CDS:2, partial [Gigaspora rosea]
TKENSSKKIYRVSKKSKERLVAKHWQIEDQDNYVEHLKLQPCKGCTLLTSSDVNSCYRHFNKKESLVPLLWQNCLVEKPTCSFIKILLTWQTATKWRISSAIMAIEPDLNQTIYNWRSFWDLKKKLAFTIRHSFKVNSLLPKSSALLIV